LTSILVDTSYLITLADKTRPHHHVAVRYFREALRHGATLHLSTIVASEFQVGQDVQDLPLRNFLVVPFNFDHAQTCGDLSRHIKRDPADSRNAAKDDLKLVAQAICESITHIITEDASTLARYVERARMAGICDIQTILLQDGFKGAHFRGGQTDLVDDADEG
jgi:predicted nucleic acid-binding protein